MIYQTKAGKLVKKLKTVVPIIGLNPAFFAGYHPWLRTEFWVTVFISQDLVDKMNQWIDARIWSCR